MTPEFGLIIIGDEILSGKRADKHLPGGRSGAASAGARPDVDHPVHGRHIELGIKGETARRAFADLIAGLSLCGADFGTEVVHLST